MDQIASVESDETFLRRKSLQYKKMNDKNETEKSGLTTEEAKELELDEQPKPTRHHSGHHSPPMSYNEEPGKQRKGRGSK